MFLDTTNGGNSFGVSATHTVLSVTALQTLTTTGTIPACFLCGTRIAVMHGEQAVEDLVVGDIVATRVNGKTLFRPITWIGHRNVDVAVSLDPLEAYPVRIRAHAFAENTPHRDLLITSEHCILVDGKLIPARMLVNNGSIIVDTSINQYEYFHIELEMHSILTAEGLETESYLDTGNRGEFANAAFAEPNPDFSIDPTNRSWADAAAPLTVDRETVQPIWQRLANRAAQMGLTSAAVEAQPTDEPDVRLLTDTGLEIRPTLSDGRTYAFVVPAGTSGLRVLSLSSRPCDTIGPFVDDRRHLGILIGKLGLGLGRRRIPVDAHLATDSLSGWYSLEGAAATARWTNGNAVLPIDFSLLQGRPAFIDIEVVDAGPHAVSALAA